MASMEDIKKKEEDQSRCEKFLEKNLTKNIKILHLLKAIEGAGCELPKDFFSCRHCDGEVTGGFKTPLKDEKGYEPQVLNSVIESMCCDRSLLGIGPFVM